MSCTITVTGASGNIGRVLADILLSRGHSVRVVGRDAGRLHAQQLAIMQQQWAAHDLPLICHPL